MFLGLAHLRKRKNQSRGRPTHFIFRVQLLEINPWLPSSVTTPPFSANSLILRWHRGDHRSGFAHSDTAYHASCDGKIPFNHVFELPVTLYCSSSSAFEEKLIIFTLHDAQYSTGPPLARGTLNLAAYHASGVDNDEPTTTTACVPLILCGHVPPRAVIPNLHILVTSSLSKKACFCEGNHQSKAQHLVGCFSEGNFQSKGQHLVSCCQSKAQHLVSCCQSKAQHLVSYLPLQLVRLLRKSETFLLPWDRRSHAALVADLLKEEDEEHQEDEKEAEIEAFTDDESSSGLRTPPEDNSLTSHFKKNTTSSEDCGLFPASSRISIAQVAWTPTPKRPCSDEHLSSLKTASEFYSSSEEAFFTSCRRASPINIQTSSGTSPSSPSFASTGKQPRLDDIKLISEDRKCVGSNDERTTHTKTPSTIQATPLLHLDVDAGEEQLAGEGSGKLAEVGHIISSSERTGLKLESHPEDNNDRVSEAEALRYRIISQLCESKVWRTNLDNLDSERMEDDDIISREEDMNVLEEARHKFAEGAEKRDAKITKRLLEESKVKLGKAESKLFAASEKVSYLQLCIGAHEGELQDAAAIEMIIFCTVSEHGGSPHSVLTCACHLAKLHNHAITNWSLQRKASLMRSTISGLILATRACGQDVARLTFWWSNVLALRHAFMLALNPVARPSSSETARNPGHVMLDDAEGSGHTDCTKPTIADKLGILGSESCDWGDPTIFGAALEKVEAWICAKVVESTWCQVFAPLTQKSTCPLESLNKDDAVKNANQESASLMFDIEDGMQQNTSIDIWKKAFLHALQKLCPVRVGGNECSCIPGLPRLVIEECISRLDALMFNAILPIPNMESSSNLVSEAQFEAQVLPIPPGHLTFGVGIQLKNVVGTWSTWLTIFLEKLSNTVANAVEMDESRRFLSFPLLKALADLLMLPRDMVTDKSVQKETDAVSPSLLAALTAEMDMEKRMYGDDVDEHVFSAAGVALRPRVAYCPQATTFKDLAGSMLDCIVSEWIRQDDGINDVLFVLKTLLTESVQTCSEILSGTSDHPVQAKDVQEQRDYCVLLHRYKLLQELWATDSRGSPSLDVASEVLQRQMLEL